MTEFPASESPSPGEGPCCGDENEIINKHVSPQSRKKCSPEKLPKNNGNKEDGHLYGVVKNGLSDKVMCT